MNLKVTHRVKFVIHKVTGELNVLYPIKYTNKMQLSMQKKNLPTLKLTGSPGGWFPYQIYFTQQHTVNPDFLPIQVLSYSVGAIGCQARISIPSSLSFLIPNSGQQSLSAGMGIQCDHLQKAFKAVLASPKGTGSTSQHDSLFKLLAGESIQRIAMFLSVRALLVISNRTWYKLAKARKRRC